jgi:predicted amidohydrolase YtcJ
MEEMDAGHIAILRRNVFAPDAGPIGDARILLTLVDGDAVYEDRALEA